MTDRTGEGIWMRRVLGLVAIVFALSGCSPAASMSISPTDAATAPATATTECLGGVPQATCDQILPLVLAAVAPSGWTPTKVWIGGGSLCPQEGCLFDPNREFPATVAPNGGQWVASAEIAFAQTDKHAGIQIAQVGSSLVPVLIGYRMPLSTWCSGTCPSTSTTDGPFRLELVLPHLDWKPTDTISGTAILSFAGSAPTTIAGAGGDMIVFSFDEVGGNRHAGWAMTADCVNHPLDPATPISANLARSGGVTGTEPAADWLRSFYADPQIHLPAGTWDITAIAVFNDGAGCSGGEHTMKATERITVGG